MAASNLAERFTQDKYASKSDVIKDLKTSLVDNIWNNILAYRRNISKKVGLRNFTSTEYSLCYTYAMDAHIQSLGDKLDTLIEKVGSIYQDDYDNLKNNSYIDILFEVAKHLGINASKKRIQNVFFGQVEPIENDVVILMRYMDALDYAYSNFSNEINQEFVLELHRILTGEIYSSYRMKEESNPMNRVLIDRIYTAAPVGQIPNLMNELFVYLNNSNDYPIVKSCALYYMICSIKPFAQYSSLVASLLMKVYLAQTGGMMEKTILLPLEKLLNIGSEVENKIFTDAQKYSDLTYFVLPALDVTESIFDGYLNDYETFVSNNIYDEYYQADVLDNSLEKEIVKEEAPKKEEKKEKKAEVKRVEVKKENGPVEAAIRYIPRGLDEKEALKLEQQLLEMDPSLKKKEAHFYAHHCTLGMNYTIQHYKRYCRVSYETARTSMDHLAELGYYKKEQLKNKFIYTPIKKN